MKNKTCKICKTQLRMWFNNLFDDRHGYPGKFQIWRCPNCGFAQTIPELNPKQISDVYTKYYPRQNFDIDSVREEDYMVPVSSKQWRKGLGINCQYWVKSKAKVLDVGCGLGQSLLELKHKNCDVFGIDPDRRADQIAKKFKLHFHCGFIEDKPFGKEKFDYILGSQVLEHTNDPVEFLQTLKGRLAPGGSIILSFPNVDSLSRKMFGSKWLHWHMPYHLNFFTYRSLELLAQKGGLKVSHIYTITPNMWTDLQLRHLLLNHKEGLRDGFWDGGKPGLEENSKGGKYWMNYLLKKVNFILEDWNLLNRLIDLLGLGDSFVVILSQ